MRALQVVPNPVKVRVVRILGSVMAALLLLLWLVRDWPLGALGLAIGCGAIGGYVGWCRWPRWRWGISAANLGELPQPPGQLVRLTFDDGPTAGVTDVVLDLLAEHRVSASFFMLVKKAEAHPELVKRVLAEGHILGLHGEDHRLPFFRSALELTESLERARAKLEQIAGQRIELYRPSHGAKNLALLQAVRTLGLRLCFWDYGVWDTDAPPSEVLLARLRATLPTAAELVESPQQIGPVVLLHDGLGDLPEIPPHARAMTEALGALLPQMRRPPMPMPMMRES